MLVSAKPALDFAWASSTVRCSRSAGLFARRQVYLYILDPTLEMEALWQL
jgi:hypothetical protein